MFVYLFFKYSDSLTFDPCVVHARNEHACSFSSMVLGVDTVIKLILLRNRISLFGAMHRFTNRYLCGIAWLIPYDIYSSSHFLCQFRFALALVALPFLFRFIFAFSVLHGLLSFPFRSHGSTCVWHQCRHRCFKACRCWRDTCADHLFPVSDFICQYGAYPDSLWFMAKWMNGDSPSV